MASGKSIKLDFSPDIDFKDILSNPIIDIAAHFWDQDRYDAFRICYRSMRIIDDLVDHQKTNPLTTTFAERFQLKKAIGDWMQGVINRNTNDTFCHELVGILEKYKIPFWPWERFYKSMVYDLENNGFSSIISFLRYSEGAAIAPASIFTHLCGIRKINAEYHKPPYDIRILARPLALFSYFVHIIRDFRKDHKNNLNYFAFDQLEKYGLTLADLKAMAHGSQITRSLRKLISAYKEIADYYRAMSRRVLSLFMPMMQPKYQLSLEIIYSLYLQIFERIDIEHGTYTKNELNPSPHEIRLRINQTISNFSPMV